MPGCFSPITPHSSPACIATSCGSLAPALQMYRLGLVHDVAGRLGLPTWITAGVLQPQIPPAGL
jgi:hypothetical protein